jgi:hypothetical protein
MGTSQEAELEMVSGGYDDSNNKKILQLFTWSCRQKSIQKPKTNCRRLNLKWFLEGMEMDQQ